MLTDLKIWLYASLRKYKKLSNSKYKVYYVLMPLLGGGTWCVCDFMLKNSDKYWLHGHIRFNYELGGADEFTIMGMTGPDSSFEELQLSYVRTTLEEKLGKETDFSIYYHDLFARLFLLALENKKY